MKEATDKLIAECRRLDALGSKLTLAEWRESWATFVVLKNSILMQTEELLDLEPLRMLRPKGD